MYTTFSPFFFICTQSLGQAYAIQRSPDPKDSHSAVSDDQITRARCFLEMRNFWACLSFVRLVARILEAEVEAGDLEHRRAVVVPGDLPLVTIVEEETPRLRFRRDLVGAVEDGVEAPVSRDSVLLPVVLAGLDHGRIQGLEVRDQLRVPRLHEAALAKYSTHPT